MALVDIVSSDGLVFDKFNLCLFILFLRILNTEKGINERFKVLIDFQNSRWGNHDIDGYRSKSHQIRRKLSLEFTANDRVSLLRGYTDIQYLLICQTMPLSQKFTLTIQSSLQFDMLILLIVANGILRSRVVTGVPSFASVMRI